MQFSRSHCSCRMSIDSSYPQRSLIATGQLTLIARFPPRTEYHSHLRRGPRSESAACYRESSGPSCSRFAAARAETQYSTMMLYVHVLLELTLHVLLPE